jgi:hypothetical protein
MHTCNPSTWEKNHLLYFPEELLHLLKACQDTNAHMGMVQKRKREIKGSSSKPPNSEEHLSAASLLLLKGIHSLAV